MTAPVEVVIDELLLRGVREADAPLLVDAFRTHLAALVTGTEPRHDTGGGVDAMGRELACAVHRVVRA